MAVLTDQDRADLAGLISKDVSSVREPLAVNKADLRSAINAADSWLDTNAGVFNAAIPQPARAALTVQQKARLLMYVIRQRFARA